MDTLIIYLIIGIIWIVQVLVKKKQEEERRKRPEEYKTEKEKDTFKDIFDELKKALEGQRQPPSEKEVIFQELKPVEEQKIEEEDQETEETYEEIPATELEQPVLLQPQTKEVLFKKIFDKYKPEAVSPEPQVETPPAPYFSSDLSSDALEQGIILSTILGPPRSVQLFKGW